MYPIFQIASEEKKLHAYQFSYDVTTGVYEDPVQAILQEFVVNGVIDCKSSFRLLHGDKVTGKAIMVRPVETTWLFHSKLTLEEIGSVIADVLHKDVKYTISEMQLQEDDILFKFKEATDLNPMDEELIKAINAVEEKTKDKSLSAYLKSHLTSLTTYVKSLAVLLLFVFGFTTNAWGYSASNATVYFNNSNSNWTYVQILTGTDSYSSGTGLSHIANTKLWVATNYSWKDYGYYMFINASGSWPGQGWKCWDRGCTAANHSKSSTYSLDSKTVIHTPKSSGNEQDWNVDQLSNGYSDLNKKQTVKVYVKKSGSSSYSEVSTVSNWPATIKANRYNLDNATTANNSDKTLSSDNYASGVITSTIKFSVTANTGYTFKGFNTTNSVPGSVTNPYSYTVTDTKTIYAFFEENTYSITYKDQGGTDFSGTWGTGSHPTSYSVTTATITLDQPTKTGYTFVGWFDNSGCTGSAVTQIANGSTGDKTLYAKWTLDAPSNPSISGELSYVVGQTISLTASATGIITSYQWYKNNDEISGATSATYTKESCTTGDAGTYKCVMTNASGSVDASVDVTVMANSYNITIAVNNSDYGTVSQSSINDVPEGTSINFGNTGALVVGTTSVTATPTTTTAQYAYAFTGWTSSDYTTGGTITKAGTVTANFTQTLRAYTITFNANTGSGSMDAQTGVQYGVSTKLNNMSGLSKTGYSFAGWAETSGGAVVYADGANITITGDKTLYAKWTAKQYTVSFDQNGGEGGQAGTVTATYNQSMPGTVTCPTRVGYKFKGYYSATSGGTQYYGANGAATSNKWLNDAAGGTAIIYAQWTQMHVYVQGRMHVANQKRSAGGDITWTNSFNGGSDDEKSRQWAEACRAIEMQLVTENDRTYYKLVTNATLSDLSSMFGNDHNLPQYFYLRSTSTTSGSTWDGHEYKQVADGSAFTLADKGEEKARAWSATGTHQPCFTDNDHSGYVIIYFDETKVWYELDEFPTRNITVNHGLGGNVEPSSTIKVGEVSWEVKATAGTGYYFKCWTASDANIHFENATQPTTKITATGTEDGSITANFVATTMIYFQKPSSWTGNDVYVYFYDSDNGYWKTEKSKGGTEKGAGASGQKDGKKMEYINDNTYRIDYYPNEAHKALAFVNDQQNGYEAFDNTSVSYRKDFDRCSVNNWFIPENKVTGYYNKHDDNQTAYYNDGYWTSYTYLPVGYFLKNSRGNWEPLDEYHFQDTEDASVKRLVINNVNQNDQIEFRIWQTCDCWLGVGATGCVIKEDTKNYGIGTGDQNVTLRAWKTGSYEFVLYTKTNSLDVTYLGDITVANFPGEVSTFVNRQHKIKPDVTLRNGTAVTDVTITVNDNTLPWSSSYATYEQNGTNLIVTGKAIGSETVTVKYANKTGYEVTRTLKVNVATPIIIQAKLKKDEDGLTDDYWSKTGLVHIHFWGSDATKTQDMDMSYNKDTKVFSVTAPKIDGFKFMFWYGEDINQSASEQWRKTNDITDCTTNTCYSISYETDKNTKRTATPKSGLCTTDEYYVEITMKNGNTYKSNTIDELTDWVSFFAPQDGVTDYTGGTVRIVHNGAVSEPITGFTTAGVYVAQIANGEGFVANSIKPYTGKYYIRTDGAAGGWNEYKNADNELVEFTRRANKNESYSYYWVRNLAKSNKTNVKADVANDYNDNLAGMIENDKFTDGGGFIYQSSNGANVRFSYEPTTNEFKRAIIGGSSDNNFLNIYSKDGGRLFADKACTKELNANADLSLSKFKDVSDWVYEKVVYAKADGSHPTNVILKSVFNGQTTHLLGYNKNAKGEDTDDPKPLEVLGATTNADTYALRISYDYKRNRLMASWEPGNLSISTNQIIDADVLFIQKEDGTTGLIDNVDVAQITYTQDGIDNYATLTSLKNIMYILEITPNVIAGTSKDNQLYWFSLPFNCNINDIFGVEDYVTLDANGRATKGTWGIQRYDGKSRADKGWFMEDTPEGFWKWMGRNETLEAGTGYVLVFDKTDADNWKSIGVEEPCKDGDPDCVDGKKTVQQQIKRLYFPSIGTSFEISYSGESSSVDYANEICKIEKRKEADSNWKVIGPKSYNNIGIDINAKDNLTFYYTYNQAEAQGHRYIKHESLTGNEQLKSFHSYMTQFGGTLTWKPFTKSTDVTPTVQAPRYMESLDFRGGLLTIELNNAQGTQLDRTFVNLSKNGTTGFDQNLDLTQIVENCAQIASVSEDVLYAGNTLPLDIEMVPLNVKVVANGTYDIALAQSLEGLEVRLYDAFEQTTTPLDLMSATVTLDKGEYKDRFFLQFVQKSPLTPTNFNGTIDQFNLPTDKTQKLFINDQIYLINAGRIYNVLGARP